MMNAFQSSVDYTICGLPKKLVVVGSDYDIMADISLGIESIFGSPDKGTEIFDNGSRLFCSCSTALAFEYFRLTHGNPYPKFFSQIQPNAFKGAEWENSILHDYQAGNSLQVVNNFPAVWANTQTHFNKEMNLVFQNFS
jgi:hypothetical protein